MTEETLEKQYELVRKRTSNNYTYNMGSHVLQFGSLSIDEEPAADYLGELNTGEQLAFDMLQPHNQADPLACGLIFSGVLQRSGAELICCLARCTRR